MKHELASVVRAELNHIYTERPHFVHGGGDMGWFCREHALHAFALAHLLGHEAEVIVGDYALSLPDGRIFTCVGDDSDHAWCMIDDVSPVDASVSTRYLSAGPEIGLVYGVQPTSGGYSVSRHPAGQGPAAIEAVAEHRPAIGYVENLTIPLDPVTSLDSPFDFLFPPAPGCPRFTDIHGADVFFQITWHCYRLAIGDTKPMHPHRSPEQTVRGAVKFNPDARARINEKLGH